MKKIQNDFSMDQKLHEKPPLLVILNTTFNYQNKITTKESTTMVQRVVSLVKTHNILSCSIININ